MGCGSCGTGTDGKPGGCKSHGSCSTSGCNRMNAYNWLSALPLSDASKPYPILEVSFSNGSRKDFYKNNTYHIFEKDQWIVLEGTGGIDIGQVSLTGELVKLQLKKYRVQEDAVVKRVLRAATAEDLELFHTQKEREKAILIRSRAIAKEFKLEMKVCEVELQADGKKATFFYTADSRVDFRELIKVYATDFKVKVEMRQIGARQEAGKVGGIGSCGRELCCSSWLTDFKSVNTNAARYQNLSINQTKLSGQCGRLKCCLNYELELYSEKLKEFPSEKVKLKTESGLASLRKIDILKGTAWYCYENSFDWIPVDIDRVNEIIAQNNQGKTPPTLSDTAKGAEVAFKTLEYKDDLLGDTDLTRMDAKNKGKKDRGPQNRNSNHKKGNFKGGNNRNAPKNRADQPNAEGDKKPAQQPRNENRPKGDGANRPKPNPNKKPNPNRPNKGNAPLPPKND